MTEQFVLAKDETLVLAIKQFVCLPLCEQVLLDERLGEGLFRFGKFASMARTLLANELTKLIIFDQFASSY